MFGLRMKFDLKIEIPKNPADALVYRFRRLPGKLHEKLGKYCTISHEKIDSHIPYFYLRDIEQQDFEKLSMLLEKQLKKRGFTEIATVRKENINRWTSFKRRLQAWNSVRPSISDYIFRIPNYVIYTLMFTLMGLILVVEFYNPGRGNAILFLFVGIPLLCYSYCTFKRGFILEVCERDRNSSTFWFLVILCFILGLLITGFALCAFIRPQYFIDSTIYRFRQILQTFMSLSRGRRLS
jgi:hypothetical protein